MTRRDAAGLPQGQVVHANGLTIYYEEYGQGDPLVLLHGGTGTGRMWEPHIAHWSAHFRLLVPDSRGHGRTDNPVGKLSYRLMADDVAAFLRTLDLHRPAVCGYSDGGQIALELGVHHPDVAGALVVGGARYSVSDAYVRSVQQFLFLQPDGRVDVEQVAQAAPDWVEAMRVSHQHVYGPDHWKTLLQWSAQMWQTSFGLTTDDFHGIAVPTLLIVGDHDTDFPVEESLAMYRAIPDAELAVFPGADHSLPGKFPEAFARTVLDFLTRRATEA